MMVSFQKKRLHLKRKENVVFLGQNSTIYIMDIPHTWEIHKLKKYYARPELGSTYYTKELHNVMPQASLILEKN